MSEEKTEVPVLRNRLLAALPAEDYARPGARLERVRLDFKQSLYEANQPIEHVYFPLSAVGSLLAVMEDGRSVEFGTVGNEGMVGLPVILGTDRLPTRVFCQVPSEAMQMTADALREEIGRRGVLAAVLRRYTQALFNQMAQSTACNRLHSISQRCARWLLMTHDRVGADEFDLTQEFLSDMLGIRRAGVSEAAGELQEAGLIQYRRGHITILNHPGLEAASGECYRTVRDELDRLLTPEEL